MHYPFLSFMISCGPHHSSAFYLKLGSFQILIRRWKYSFCSYCYHHIHFTETFRISLSLIREKSDWEWLYLAIPLAYSLIYFYNKISIVNYFYLTIFSLIKKSIILNSCVFLCVRLIYIFIFIKVNFFLISI
jgi:hypothetical protein